MSYDLYLSSPRLNGDSFARYFEGRTHYEQAEWYANKETGVYFSFEYSRSENDGESDDGPPGAARVAFNMNYFRPHTFGLEAEPEVTAFVAAFGCTIDDPQMEGMGAGPYSPAGFLHSWNTGNAFGYRAIGAKGNVDNVLLADGERIERVWRWNFQSQARQLELGESCFVPRVSWGKRLSDGAPITFAVWGEGVRTAFPECATHALLMRKRSVRTSWLLGEKKEVMESKLVSIREVESLDGCAWREVGNGKLLLAPVDVPPSREVISAFSGGFGEPKAILKVFAPDHVLDESLMAQVQR